MNRADVEELARALRLQSIVDASLSAFIAILLWPFPIARAMLPPVVHVAGVLVLCVAVHFVHLSIASAILGRTMGMRLAGLKLVAADDRQDSRLAGALWGLAAAVKTPVGAFAPRILAARWASETSRLHVELVD